MFSGTGSLLRVEWRTLFRANSARDIQAVIGIATKHGYELSNRFDTDAVFTFPKHVDPKTVSWLKANIDPIFGYPNIVRFSWATCKTLLETSGKAVRWYVFASPSFLLFQLLAVE